MFYRLQVANNQSLYYICRGCFNNQVFRSKGIQLKGALRLSCIKCSYSKVFYLDELRLIPRPCTVIEL
jgi:hypothetical protein